MNQYSTTDVIKGKIVMLIPRSIKVISVIKLLYNDVLKIDPFEDYTLVTNFDILDFNGIENIEILNYKQISEINTKKNLIFDSLEKFYFMRQNYNFFCEDCNFIFMSSWGDSPSILESFSKLYSDAKVIAVDIFGVNRDIKFGLVKAGTLDPMFYDFYTSIRDYELNTFHGNDPISSFPLSRMVTNYFYPPDMINDVVNSNWKECNNDSLEKDYKWLTFNEYKSLKSKSPKIYWILSKIKKSFKKNPKCKIIIASKYVKKFGIDLIFGFLQYAISNKEILLNSDDIYYCSCLKSRNENINEIKLFKESEKGILLTNIIPDTESIPVDYVYFLDCYKFNSIRGIIKACRPIRSQYKIKFVIATSPSEEILSDEALAKMVFRNLELYNNFFIKMFDKSSKLIKNYKDEYVISSPYKISTPASFVEETSSSLQISGENEKEPCISCALKGNLE